MRLAVWAAILFTVVVSPSCAETIAHCGKSVGKEYAEGGKWVDVDGNDFPETTVVRVGLDYDVLFRDPLGMRSVRSGSGTVVKVEGDDNHDLTLVVVYPLGTVELYQLTLDQNGRGQLFWTSVKHFSLINAKPIGGFYVADCSR